MDSHRSGNSDFIELLKNLRVHYEKTESKKDTHYKDILNLEEELRIPINIYDAGNVDAEDIIRILEKAFNKQLESFTSPHLFFKAKKADEFPDHLNENTNGHHYSRLLGLMLQIGYLENPGVKPEQKSDVFAITTPTDHKVYDAIFQIKIKTDNATYISLNKEFPNTFSPRDIDNMSLGQQVLTVKLAKKLAPSLNKKYLFKDDEIKTLLTSGATDKLIDTGAKNLNFLDNVITDFPAVDAEKKAAAIEQKKAVEADLKGIYQKISDLKSAQKSLMAERYPDSKKTFQYSGGPS